MLIDVHCHLTHELFSKDLDKVIAFCKEKGVKVIIGSGVNPEDNKKLFDIATKYPDFVKVSYGIYPIDALGLGSDESGIVRHKGLIDLDKEFEFILKNKDKIISIGEVGMDFKMDLEKHDKQRENFLKIIKFCEKFGKPIVIHSRKAETEIIDMLEKSKLKKVVLHCFEGRKHVIDKAIKLGYSFSIPCTILKMQHFQELVRKCPIQQLLTETDAPWLSPVPGERNNSSNVRLTVQKIAELKGISYDECENLIFMNYQRMYL